MQNDTELNKIFDSCMANFKIEFPELEKHGAGSILSKYYGKADILFMGLNPGGDGEDAQKARIGGDYYIDIDDGSGPEYWQRAKDMQRALSPYFFRDAAAVFGNVFPVATPGEKDLKAEYEHHFAPLFDQIMRDVQPKVIIFAGVRAPRVLANYVWHMRDENGKDDEGIYAQTKGSSPGILTWDGHAIPCATIMHFSAPGWTHDIFTEDLKSLKAFLDEHLKS